MMRWKLFAMLGLLALFPILLLFPGVDGPRNAVTTTEAAALPQPVALPVSPEYQYLIFKTKTLDTPMFLLVQQTQPVPEQAPPGGPAEPVPGPGGGGYAGWGWSWWWWVIIIILIIFFIIIFSSWGGRGGRTGGGPPPPDERL